MTRRADVEIRTHSGRLFRPLAPRVEDVDAADIAHALAFVCRWTGHVSTYYSVAEHSVRVSYACAPADALAGLLHDASEAYVCDVSSPLKRSPLMAGYRAAEARLQAVIFRAFGLPARMPASVKAADRLLASVEARDLMGGLRLDVEPPARLRIRPWSAETARRRWLSRLAELQQQREGRAA